MASRHVTSHVEQAQQLATARKTKRLERTRARRSAKAGRCIYFVQEGEDGSIKIGLGPPKHRLVALQIGNPRQLHLRRAIPDGCRHDEKAFHTLFADYHVRGEWFEPASRLLDFMHSDCLPEWYGKIGRCARCGVSFNYPIDLCGECQIRIGEEEAAEGVEWSGA